MPASKKYQLALLHASGFGNQAYHQLLSLLTFNELTLADIFDKPVLLTECINKVKPNAVEAEFKSKHLFSQTKLDILTKYLKQPAWDKVEQDLLWAEQKHNHILTSSNKNYPQLLKQQSSYPMLLYIMGSAEILKDIQIAIVGSRSPTPTAIDNAHQFAYYMAQQGMVITSGMAMGIDTAAHKGALSAKGKTIAVAGTGLDRVYPAKNKELAHEIVASGAIISEFPLGTGPLKGNFPKRNQIISGLSVGTLVVEAAIKSGSLITARIAMEQGREVFAIPGSIHNPLAKGCHYLIKQGAKLVETAQDIIEEVAPLSFASSTMQTELQLDAASTDVIVSIPASLPKDQQKILNSLDETPISIDQLQQRCHLAIDDVNALLLILEIEGYIKSLPGGKVARTYS